MLIKGFNFGMIEISRFHLGPDSSGKFYNDK